MTQSTTYKALKKFNRWVTIKELSEVLEQSTGSIGVNLNKLQKQGEVLKLEGISLYGGNRWKIKEEVKNVELFE